MNTTNYTDYKNSQNCYSTEFSETVKNYSFSGDYEGRKSNESHAAEPIKDENDIVRISEYLIGKGRYRDNMLFVCGINFGLRCTDLLNLRFGDIVDPMTGRFYDSFTIKEQKTGKLRTLNINADAAEAISLYMQNNETTDNDFLFKGQSLRNQLEEPKPLTRRTVDRILKNIGKELNLPYHMSTHTLRKTFAYQLMKQQNNDPRMLDLVMDLLNHSNLRVTLKYIGITSDEKEQAYKSLSLGRLGSAKKPTQVTGNSVTLYPPKETPSPETDTAMMTTAFGGLAA